MRYMILLGHGALIVALIAAPHSALAQTTAVVTVSGGTVTDQLGRGSSAVSLSPRVAVALAPAASLTLGGTATRFASAAWALGAVTELAGRQRLGRIVALTLNGAVTGSYLGGSATGSFTAAEALPAIEVRASRLKLYGGARAASGRATEQRSLGGLPALGAGVSSTRVSRTGAGTVFGVLVDVIDHADRSATISVREERLAVAGSPSIDRAVSAAISFGRGSLGGSLGRRVAPDENRTISNAALSLPLGGAATLDLGVGRYASNRILGTPGGDYATAGISWSFGGERAWRPPLPSRTPRPAPGLTRLAIRAPATRSVEVAGDFNEWTPVSARRAENDVWYVDLRIPPGRYRYAFRINGAGWRVPDGATAVDDGFGGQSAWLVVHDPGPR